MPSPAKYTFQVYQGQTWEEMLTINNPDGSPSDLTGYVARMHVRAELPDPDPPILVLTTANGRLVITDPVAGEITLLVSAEDTAGLPLNFEQQVWVYDMEIVRDLPAPEYVQRILEGNVVAFPEVTRT